MVVITYDSLLLIVILLLIFSGSLLFRHKKHHAMTWMLRLLNSRDREVQLHLYFALITIISIFFYTAYAVLCRGFIFDVVSFGKGIGVIFVGVGISSVGNGLQLKEDGNLSFITTGDHDKKDDLIDIKINQAEPLFTQLCDSDDGTIEMHLFLGAIALITVILYTGYDLAYTAKDFQPFSYGQALAYTFSGVGAAGWGQGLQRKFQATGVNAKKIADVQNSTSQPTT